MLVTFMECVLKKYTIFKSALEYYYIIAVVAGDIFFLGGGGKCPKVRCGLNIFMSHTLKIKKIYNLQVSIGILLHYCSGGW